jgi:hypothetical protein
VIELRPADIRGHEPGLGGRQRDHEKPEQQDRADLQGLPAVGRLSIH